MFESARFQDAINDVSQILPHIANALEHATQWAQQQQLAVHHQTGNSQPLVAAYYRPNAVRFYFLLAAQSSPELQTCQISPLANNGIRIHYKDWVIKLLKATSDLRVPPIGRTKSMKLLYQTILSGEYTILQHRHLLLLWQTDSDGFFLGLSLVSSVDGKFHQIPLEWRLDMPHPIAIEDLHFLASQDDDDEESGDLPFERDSDQQVDTNEIIDEDEQAL
jgi:hypothetical protein